MIFNPLAEPRPRSSIMSVTDLAKGRPFASQQRPPRFVEIREFRKFAAARQSVTRESGPLLRPPSSLLAIAVEFS